MTRFHQTRSHPNLSHFTPDTNVTALPTEKNNLSADMQNAYCYSLIHVIYACEDN